MTTDDYLYFLNNYKNLNLKFCEKDIEYFYQNYKIIFRFLIEKIIIKIMKIQMIK